MEQPVAARQRQRRGAGVGGAGVGKPEIVRQHRADLRRDEAPLAEQMAATLPELAHAGTAAVAEEENRLGHHRAILGETEGQRIDPGAPGRSEEHTSELQSLMRTSYAVFSLKKKKRQTTRN